MASRMDELMASLREETGNGYAWSNGPGDRYSAHSHEYEKVLYCVEGSITFLLPDGEIHLEPGERLVLPPGTAHAAVVGPRGVVCVEGHRVPRPGRRA
jgi:quercetin dioxygenase-like cupin family protein